MGSTKKIEAPSRFKVIRAVKPKDGLKEFIGKTLLITMEQPEGGTEVVVETITGSILKEFATRFEINGRYHINILDAYAQLTGAKDVSEKDIEEFGETVAISVQPVKETDDLAEKPPEFIDKDGNAVRAIMLMNPKTAAAVRAAGADLGTATNPNGQIMPIEIQTSIYPKDGLGHMLFNSQFIGTYNFSKYLPEEPHDEPPATA